MDKIIGVKEAYDAIKRKDSPKAQRFRLLELKGMCAKCHRLKAEKGHKMCAVCFFKQGLKHETD